MSVSPRGGAAGTTAQPEKGGGGAQFEPGEAQGFPGVDTDTLLLPKVQEHPGLCLGDQSFCLER